MRSSTSFDVVVIGAGTAGLATAWYAARRGLSVVVVDRDDEVGGLASSRVVDGQRVDLGSHGLESAIEPDVLDDLRGLLGDELQWREPGARIRVDGHWLAFPMRTVDLLRHTSVRLAAGMARDALMGPWRAFRGRSAARGSFRDQVRHDVGPAFTAAVYEPYARKLWGLDPHQLSPDLIRRRPGARRGTALLRRLARRTPRAGCWYPTGGFGRIPEALAADLIARGGRVVLATEARRVEASHHGVTVHLGECPVRARTLVTTTSPKHLIAMFDDVPLIVHEAVHQMRERAALIVYLSVPRPHYTELYAHHLPAPDHGLLRLSEPKAYRSSPDDPADRTVLCAELPATVGDALWALDDEALAEHVRRALISSDLPDPTPTLIHVERRVGVYPVYELGFERRERVIDAWVNGLPNVVALRRQRLFAYDNTHRMLEMGRAVAGCLRDDGTLDARRWRETRASLRSHLVEA